jgi:hypothetical protein
VSWGGRHGAIVSTTRAWGQRRNSIRG